MQSVNENELGIDICSSRLELDRCLVECTYGEVHLKLLGVKATRSVDSCLSLWTMAT